MKANCDARCIITMWTESEKAQTGKRGPKKKQARLARMIGSRLNRYCQPRRICNGTLRDQGKNDPSIAPLLCPLLFNNDMSLLLQ